MWNANLLKSFIVQYANEVFWRSLFEEDWLWKITAHLGHCVSRRAAWRPWGHLSSSWDLDFAFSDELYLQKLSKFLPKLAMCIQKLFQHMLVHFLKQFSVTFLRKTRSKIRQEMNLCFLSGKPREPRAFCQQAMPVKCFVRPDKNF